MKHIFNFQLSTFNFKIVLFTILYSVFTSFSIIAQDTSRLRISILTCGTGEELYSSFGHSAVRIIDSNKGTDVVYNYGTFNFSDPDFYLKFTKGLLPYYINDDEYNRFLGTYQEEKRSVIEQVLNLSQTDAESISAFLINNLKPENKEYKYDFCFDNCSTRIRDIFSKTFDKRFTWSKIIPNDSVRFRTILDYYLRNAHWERFGINMLLTSNVDAYMTNQSIMFLPNYLMKGFQDATLDGHQLVAQTIQLLPESNPITDKPNIPKRVFWGLLIGVVIISLTRFKKLLLFFDVFYFLVLGLLGCLMLFMWFGTEHASVKYNRNLFIFLPTHLIFAFLLPRKPTWVSKYAKVASWIILIGVLSSLFFTQKYMAELTPLILLTLYRLRHYTKQVHYLPY
jgi:hypothetical protein